MLLTLCIQEPANEASSENLQYAVLLFQQQARQILLRFAQLYSSWLALLQRVGEPGSWHNSVVLKLGPQDVMLGGADGNCSS